MNKKKEVSLENYSPMSVFERIIFTFLLIVGLFTTFRYTKWWFIPSHIPTNWLHTPFHFFDVFIFGALSFVVFLGLFLKIGTWFTIWFIKRPKQMEFPQNLYRVAFITCYVPGKEPMEMLEETLVAMRDAHYQHHTWVLDEGNDPEVKKLCNKIGVFHFSRKDQPHYNQTQGFYRARTKAGNLNSWRHAYEHHYDIVAQIDMDHKPHKNYLIRQLSFFSDPKVGYIIIPQIYKNTKNWIAKAAAEQTHFYYGPLQQGLYGSHMPFLIGTTHLYRVEAMKGFGGYSPTIAEDYLTGMHFTSNNWKGVYLPEVLAQGHGPTNWTDYYNQQMRWSYGLYEILFKHTHRHFPKLSFIQKINLSFSQMFYFSGVATLIGFILTSLYLSFGINSSNMSLFEWCVYALPAYISGYLIYAFLHRYYIEPSKEPAIGIYGSFLSIAASIIYAIAFFNFITRKKLTYKVTAKGNSTHGFSNIPSLAAHIILLLFAVIALEISYILHHSSLIMRFWDVLNIFLISALLLAACKDSLITFFVNIKNQYNLFEFEASSEGFLPNAPTDEEKYLYIKRSSNVLLIPSLISFSTIQISMFGFITNNLLLWPLLGYFILTITYFLISLIVNAFSGNFDIDNHKKLVNKWEDSLYADVDIFLPTAGEPIEVLQNTWDGVKDMLSTYKGRFKVYCLDDANRSEVNYLASSYGFIYEVRPNRGWFKKAGNLRHGFKISEGKFIAIFDADFRPSKDFLKELLPYFYEDSKIGIVQSPQYFDVDQKQNWLQRGAGAVQELFYRFCQVSRQRHSASICVGSNAIYRRQALNDTDGTALIEHSEDVHTGFNIQLKGWKLQYIPIIVAKGLCPTDMKAFFKQQYRWCCGSMSLLSSEKFWTAKISDRGRLSYFSGFFYYIHTAFSSIFVPIIPLALILLYPDQVNLINYLLILPSIIFTQLIYPLWHNSTYGIEAWSTRLIYGWAHLFALFDTITERIMSWQPTGSKINTDARYVCFRVLQIIFNFIPALAWVALSGFYLVARHNLMFTPLLITGIYFFFISAKITFYHIKPLMTFSFTSLPLKIATASALIIICIISILPFVKSFQYDKFARYFHTSRLEVEDISISHDFSSLVVSYHTVKNP
ncbi:MAG: glycosyltransferase family 2 protein [Candidatus Levyibacteriota bacterium]